jgi:hypothetical protein
MSRAPDALLLLVSTQLHPPVAHPRALSHSRGSGVVWQGAARGAAHNRGRSDGCGRCGTYVVISKEKKKKKLTKRPIQRVRRRMGPFRHRRSFRAFR